MTQRFSMREANREEIVIRALVHKMERTAKLFTARYHTDHLAYQICPKNFSDLDQLYGLRQEAAWSLAVR